MALWLRNRTGEFREAPLGIPRRRVVDAVENGVHPEDAAIAYNCGRPTVYSWLASYDVDGPAALSVKKSTGAVRS
jgi:transposase